MEEEKKIIRVRCTYCESAFIYFKVKEKVWQCRSCGKTFEHKEE